MAFQCSPKDVAPVLHVTCGIFCSACTTWADDHKLLL